jgi:hypothetical protein
VAILLSPDNRHESLVVTVIVAELSVAIGLEKNDNDEDD